METIAYIRTPDEATAARVLQQLRGRIGKENAVTARQLAIETGSNERQVRRIIAAKCSEWGREHGLVLVCAGNVGFYVATEAEEVGRRRELLVRLALQAGRKLTEYEGVMQRAGFGGLIKTQRRRDAEGAEKKGVVA